MTVGKLSGAHPVPAVPLRKAFVIRFLFKERLHTLNFRIHTDAGPEPVDEIGDSEFCCILPAAEGGADGSKEMRVLRLDDLVTMQVQGADKGIPQLRHEVQRTAQEGHVAPDGLSLGQTGDGLIHHRLENGGCQILPGSALVDERLNVGFGKYAAAGGDGINHLVVLCQLVETGGIRIQKRCHLVDEGAGTAGADAVHPLVDAAPEINDFGVLTAQLDGYVGVRTIVLQGCGHCHNLLTEESPHMCGQGQAAGAGDDGCQAQFPQLFPRLCEKISQGLLDVCKMSFVIGKENLFVNIQNGDFHGGRTDVNSKSVLMCHIINCSIIKY